MTPPTTPPSSTPAGGGQFVGYQCAGTSNTPQGWSSNDWPDVLSNLSPYMYAYMGIAIALAFSVIGSAWGIWTTGTSLVGASVKAPRIRSRNLISVIFCEATAIYGLIIAVILSGRIPAPPGGDGMGVLSLIPGNKCALAYFAGFAYFFSGCCVGFTNLIAGVAVGVRCQGWSARPCAPD